MSTNYETPPLDDWVTQAEAARIRGVTRQAIYRLISKQRVSTIEIAGIVLINRKEISEYIPKRAGRPKKNG